MYSNSSNQFQLQKNATAPVAKCILHPADYTTNIQNFSTYFLYSLTRSFRLVQYCKPMAQC